MAGPITGPGQLLANPSGVYPASILPNGEILPTTNTVSLAPGQELPIPRGRYWIDPGPYCVVQFLDGVSGSWRGFNSARPSPVVVDSDGFNFRVANLTGCAVAAIVTTAGTSYVQSSTTITSSAGGSLWQAVVGGLVNTTITVSAAGAGYGVPPLVFLPPPPNPGVPASAVAVISSGTVSSITVLNQGAGYTSAPTPQILPNPSDPNFLSGSITSQATGVTTLVGSGTLAAVLCTNNGASFSTVPSLTVAGAGSSGAATIVPMWTCTSISITSGGAGYSTTGGISSVGGIPSAVAAHTNPAVELTGYVPRPLAAGITAATGGTITTIGTIYDGGLFTGTPTVFVQGGAASTNATLAAVLGSVNATCIMQKID